VRTKSATNYEDKLARKTRTSGCAVGTVFGDMMEGLDGITLPPSQLKTSDLYALAAQINTTPSLYLSAGAIHGTVLCRTSAAIMLSTKSQAGCWPTGSAARISCFIPPAA